MNGYIQIDSVSGAASAAAKFIVGDSGKTDLKEPQNV